LAKGGYFFFVIFITSAIIETIKVRSKNNSLGSVNSFAQIWFADLDMNEVSQQ